MSPLCFFSTTIYHSQPVQPNPPRYYSKVGQAGVQQPTLPLQASPRCPTAARAGGSQVVRVKGSEQQRDWRGGKQEKSASFYFFTFLVHCLTVLTSSEMTMSTHLVQGSLIFPICLFTMVSKAMSGVKRPVLPDTERSSHRAERREEEEELVERKKREGIKRVG